MTFSPATIQRIIKLLPFLQPVFKALSTSFYELEHADEIAARNQLEQQWQAKEAGYKQQIGTLTRQVENAAAERVGLQRDISDRDKVIAGLQANLDKQMRTIQEESDAAKVKEQGIAGESPDDALRSDL